MRGHNSPTARPTRRAAASSKDPSNVLRSVEAAHIAHAISDSLFHDAVTTKLTSKPVCEYGAKCYRRNPQHFQEYDHPKATLGDAGCSTEEATRPADDGDADVFVHNRADDEDCDDLEFVPNRDDDDCDAEDCDDDDFESESAALNKKRRKGKSRPSRSTKRKDGPGTATRIFSAFDMEQEQS